MFEINTKMKRHFKCEIKNASRWQQVTVKLVSHCDWTESFNEWFIQERNTSYSSEMQNSAVAVFGIIYFGEI